MLRKSASMQKEEVMPYFVEREGGVFEIVEKDFDMADLDEGVVAAYTIDQKVTRKTTFETERVKPKPERRFRCKDGKLRTKSEMSEEDKAFLSERMTKTRAARKSAATE